MERLIDVVENGDVDDRNQYDEQLLQTLRDRVRQLCANSFSEQAVVRARTPRNRSTKPADVVIRMHRKKKKISHRHWGPLRRSSSPFLALGAGEG